VDGYAVEVFGLSDLAVTEQARVVAESAGYKVRMNLLCESDLPTFFNAWRVWRLPTAFVNDEVLQGMGEIRSFFEGSARAPSTFV